MTLGPVGVPPGLPPHAGACARCGRRIGSYLAYPGSVGTGAPPERICYRCHRLANRGHLPPSVTAVPVARRGRNAEFLLYRLGMLVIAGITLTVVSRTRDMAQFLYGLAGVVLLYTLSRRVRPRRVRRADGEPDAAGAAERAWRAAVEAEGNTPGAPPSADRVDGPADR